MTYHYNLQWPELRQLACVPYSGSQTSVYAADAMGFGHQPVTLGLSEGYAPAALRRLAWQ